MSRVLRVSSGPLAGALVEVVRQLARGAVVTLLEPAAGLLRGTLTLVTNDELGR